MAARNMRKASLWRRIAGAGAAALATGFFSARMMSFGVQFDGTVHPGLSKAFYFGDMVELFLDNPFYIAWGNETVAAGALVAAAGAALLVVLLTGGSRMRLNEDTETAHGDARLANDREKGDLLDTRNPCNNFMYTENSGIVFEPWDDRTKKQSYAKNLNSVTLGISGLGKTFNLVTPMLMQAVGNRLQPLPYGLSAAAGKLMRRKAMDPEKWLASPKRRRYVSRKAEAKGVGEGYDVFVTDPKGDCLRDCGDMFVAAGFDVRVMNMLDLRESCGINPFAYVSTRPNDIVDVKQATLSVSVDGGEAREVTTQTDLSGGDGDGIRWSLEGTTETLTDAMVPSGFEPVPSEDAKERIGSRGDAGDPTVEEIRAATEFYNLCALAEGMPTKGQDSDGSSDGGSVGEMLSEYRFQRSFGILHFHAQNESSRNPAQLPCRIVFDRRLVVDAVVGQGRFYDIYIDEDTDSYVVDLDAALFMGDACDVVVAYHVVQQNVPDGAALQKIVETMVSNLGTQPGENSSQDPFWEDTKKLAFMSFASYLFEAYDEEYRNIPELMRMLDMALPEGGDLEAKSPLAVLMEKWQTGMTWEAPEASIPAGSEDFEHVAAEEKSGWKVALDTMPHDRHLSMALHCYYAFTQAPPETVQSIVATCQAALVNLNAPEIKEVLRHDELGLDRLGEAGQASAVFCIVSDTPSPYDFLTAMVAQVAIDNGQERAYRVHDGKLPRHVRFILDEVANIGKIPVLLRALAVVRSRNMSVHMFLQSMAQLQVTYGEKEADVIMDNCSTWNFLGAQTSGTLEMISKKIGEETVYSRVLNRSFSGNAITSNSASESFTGVGRKVLSESQLQQMSTDEMLCFIYNHLPIQDTKIQTAKHPLYPYVSPQYPRKLFQPEPVFGSRFDYKKYAKEKEERGCAA